MAKITKPLTNTEVKQAKPKDKENNVADGDGLQLRIKPNGLKFWLSTYQRPITKKRANLSLGRYPELPIAEARRLREEARELLIKNIDPKAQKDKQQREKLLSINSTLRVVFEERFSIKKTKIAEVTAISLQHNFENHIFPKLSQRPIDQINAPETIFVIKNYVSFYPV